MKAIEHLALTPLATDKCTLTLKKNLTPLGVSYAISYETLRAKLYSEPKGTNLLVVVERVQRYSLRKQFIINPSVSLKDQQNSAKGLVGMGVVKPKQYDPLGKVTKELLKAFVDVDVAIWSLHYKRDGSVANLTITTKDNKHYIVELYLNYAPNREFEIAANIFQSEYPNDDYYRTNGRLVRTTTDIEPLYVAIKIQDIIEERY